VRRRETSSVELVAGFFLRGIVARGLVRGGAYAYIDAYLHAIRVRDCVCVPYVNG
jgi:hypothetical protein